MTLQEGNVFTSVCLFRTRLCMPGPRSILVRMCIPCPRCLHVFGYARSTTQKVPPFGKVHCRRRHTHPRVLTSSSGHRMGVACILLECIFAFILKSPISFHDARSSTYSHYILPLMDRMLIITAHKFAKVMFLRVSVCQQRGSPGPHVGGKLIGRAGGAPGLHPGRGSPGPHPRVSGGCIPACTEAETPKHTATVAGGTHPTGINSC